MSEQFHISITNKILETGYFDTQLTFLTRYNTVQIRRKTADKVRLIQINELQSVLMSIKCVNYIINNTNL